MNLDVFAWEYTDMVEINPKVACHPLKIDLKIKPKMQRRRAMGTKMYEALKNKVGILLENGFIREAQYLVWVCNLILVPKK